MEIGLAMVCKEVLETVSSAGFSFNFNHFFWHPKPFSVHAPHEPYLRACAVFGLLCLAFDLFDQREI